MTGKIGSAEKTIKAKNQNSFSQIRKTSNSPSRNPTFDGILFLQKTAGNLAVQRLLKSGTLQTKLMIGQPGDKYEQGTQPGKEEEEKNLQTKKASGSTPEATPELESRISAIRGGGQPLSESVRAFFEPRFGHDFSGVRAHTDAKAARAVNARAFTVGRDIVFGKGEYAPGTSEGQNLIAHELTHVVQQQSGKKASLIPNLQLKERTEWRTRYRTKKEAEAQNDYLKRLGLEVEEPINQKNLWIFYYYPLTRDEAEAEKKKKEPELGKKYTLTVEFDKKARSFFVKKIIKCPEAIPTKADYRIWDKCFAKKTEAEKLYKKFETAFIEAEIYKLDESHYGIYYKPLTKKEAEKAGKEAAEKRSGFAEGMFTVKVSENKELKSYTYRLETSCPKGYQDMGNFLITAYVLAQEREFPEKPLVNNPCGLKGTFRNTFLFQTDRHPRGVKMQGSGLALSGDIIHYDTNKKCFEIVQCPPTASGKCATTGRTVAADPNIIPVRKQKELLIEDVGFRVAEDTGGSIKGRHIDVYYGTDLSINEALKKSMTKKVCMKK